MKSISVMIAAAAFFAAVSHLQMPAAAASPPPEDARRVRTCDTALVQSLIDELAAACPCQGDWGAKRDYRTCLRTAQRAIRDRYGKAFQRSCIQVAFRCGSLSTCGEPDGVVTCTKPRRGRCRSGLCSDDISRTCKTKADCLGRCDLAESSAECDSSGGVSASGSCCD